VLKQTDYSTSAYIDSEIATLFTISCKRKAKMHRLDNNSLIPGRQTASARDHRVQ